MNLHELKDYKNWVGKTPSQIIEEIKNVGGWTAVFPDSNWLPIWAHRVRNFFNREPLSLRVLSKSDKAQHLKNIEKGLQKMKNVRYDSWYSLLSLSNAYDTIVENKGLSGDVYIDQTNLLWFQMSPGSTIYHWGRKPIVPFVESPWQQYKGQEEMPVFKLIAPDGTGGSRETIINNINSTSTIVSEGDGMVSVSNLINTKYKDQGSYNYSETVIKGISAHERRDVIPHAGSPNAYINPKNRFSRLTERVFPKFASNEIEPLELQIKPKPAVIPDKLFEPPGTSREV